MEKISSVYSNAVIGNSLFNLTDNYYQEMAELVIRAALRCYQAPGQPKLAADIGAGLGISALEALRLMPGLQNLFAIEPEPEMMCACRRVFLADPRVQVICKTGQDIKLSDFGNQLLDVVYCSETFHLFHTSLETSLVDQVLVSIFSVLGDKGVLAFNLGPSNADFETFQINNHQFNESDSSKICSELSHPLYQRFHKIVLDIVKQTKLFEGHTLWPDVKLKMDFNFIKSACEKAGFVDLQCSEVLLYLEPERVLRFMANGWSVFFRTDEKLSSIKHNKKLAIINNAFELLFKESDFAKLMGEAAFHPTKIYKAIKA